MARSGWWVRSEEREQDSRKMPPPRRSASRRFAKGLAVLGALIMTLRTIHLSTRTQELTTLSTNNSSGEFGFPTRLMMDKKKQNEHKVASVKTDEEDASNKSHNTTPKEWNAHRDNKKTSPELPTGILSTKDVSFFRNLQQQVDEDDPVKRCGRYGWTYSSSSSPPNNKKQRRIFFGALIASEPWEIFEIVAAETYGVFSGMVWVEGNRTQNLTPRPFGRLDDGPVLAKLFGLDERNVQVRAYVQEDNLKNVYLDREHEQRAEILQGWKELGMRDDDVGLLADTDEFLTRDFLRALQTCDGIDQFDYESHHCEHSHVKLIAVTRVFETSPECITKGRAWHHPDLIIGHCLEGIGDHPPPPRDRAGRRAQGYGSKCSDWEAEAYVADKKYPSWNAADFRRTCGGNQVRLNKKAQLLLEPERQLGEYTAFHAHNFFADFNATRFKYLTYGHADEEAEVKSIEELSQDNKVMYRCVKNLEDDPEQKWKRVEGGFDGVEPFLPIYFHDEDYRRRRHDFVREMIEADERLMKVKDV